MSSAPSGPGEAPDGPARDDRHADRDARDVRDDLGELLAARSGTGVAFPAAVAAHVRGAPDAALAEALVWATSPDPGARLVALEVTAALALRTRAAAPETAAAPDRPREAAPERVRTALLEQAGAAAAGDDADLRWAAAKALGQGGSPAVDLLVRLARDPDADVRWQAISSLPLVAGSPAHPAVVDALAAATADADDDVADHAVFALGLQLDVDAPAVRDALAAHLGALDRPDTAAAAGLALAQRGDPRAARAVRAALEAALVDADALGEVEEDWIEAAAVLGAGSSPDPEVVRLHRLVLDQRASS